MFSENVVYLSKRNLLTLLSKLERFEAGDTTACAIIKHSNHLDPYSMRIGGEDSLMVCAIPDEKYYAARKAGPMHPDDDPNPKQAYTLDEAYGPFTPTYESRIETLTKALEHCQDIFIKYEINRIDGEEIGDNALKIIYAALNKE